MSFYKENKYFIILFAVFVVLLYIEYTKPKPIDWSISLSAKDKIPYGTYILRHEIENVFDKSKIIDNYKSYYQLFKEEENASIIFINYSFSPSSENLKRILDYAEKGNNLFISSVFLSDFLCDTLNFTLKYDFSETLYSKDEEVTTENTNTAFWFTNKKLDTKKYFYKKSITNSTFLHLDSSKTTILGKSSIGTNFIKIKHGKGNIFVHLEPLVFSNYNLLTKKNYQYAFNALSYLPYGKIIWDNYLDNSRLTSEEAGNSPLYFVLENPPLAYAWYILLLGLFLLIIFEAKRKQRIIPIINPPKNTSLEFIKTIGNLYLQKSNHKDLAEKKFKYFVEHLKNKYNISISNFDDKQIEKIAEKTNTMPKTINEIFKQFYEISAKKTISKNELISFNKEIELFYTQSK